jgi:hypothetical protein
MNSTLITASIFILSLSFNLLAEEIENVNFYQNKALHQSEFSFPFTISPKSDRKYMAIGRFDEQLIGFNIELIDNWSSLKNEQTNKYVHKGKIKFSSIGQNSDTFLNIMSDKFNFEKEDFRFEDNLIVEAKAITSTKEMDNENTVRIMINFSNSVTAYLVMDRANQRLSLIEGIDSSRGTFLYHLRKKMSSGDGVFNNDCIFDELNQIYRCKKLTE